MNFIKDRIEELPIKSKVFQDYDMLDELAEKQGYFAKEMSNDEDIPLEGLNRVGFSNRHLHSGWIATMGDRYTNPQNQIKALNQKIDLCKSKGEDIIIGFCRTGNFSVGYSIYVKKV